jgi:CheY-like chemotaxis protein
MMLALGSFTRGDGDDIGAQPRMPMSEERTSPLRGVRILIVEDHDDTREALDAQLTLLGALVLSAPTALEALPQVVMCDVVVTDLAMSGRDGRWLVEQVAASARPIPVIAVTGYDEDYDLRAAPFARVLTKPVDPERLVAEILQVIGRRTI